MKFSCLQSELNHHLSLVSRAVPLRPSRPVLGNILVMADAKQQTVTLVASDEVLGMESRFPAKVETPGNLTLPAKLWGDLTSRLPNEAVHLETDVDETTVIITSSPGRYEIRGLGAEDYPALPSVDAGAVVSLSAESLLHGLEGCLFAASNDETKQVLTGVHWLSDEDTLEFAATDGHRLAVVKAAHKTGGTIPPIDTTVPAKALQALAHMIKACAFTGMVQVRWNNTQILFDLDGQKLTTDLLEGPYPNYRQLLPKQLARQVTIDRDELVNSLNRVEVLARQDSDVVTLLLNKAVQQISLVGKIEEARGRENLPVQMSGNDLEVAFNIRYLLDGLKALNSQQVQIQCNTPTSPVIFSPLGGDTITCLVMPIQIRNVEPESLDDKKLSDFKKKNTERLSSQKIENLQKEEVQNSINKETENFQDSEPEKIDFDETDLSFNESDWLEAINIADLEDKREKDLKLVVIREGQAAFRENLLSAYDGRCAITGYSVKDVLEAAHIVPYLGVKTNHLSNGLILRSDLHKLFDLFKITVNPDTLMVCVAPELMETEYRELNGKPLRKVCPKYPPVSRNALRHHFNQCFWIEALNSC